MTIVSFVSGTGPAGFGLAARFARAGDEVVIGSRALARAEEAQAMVLQHVPGASVRAMENADAIAAGEVVFLTMPPVAQRESVRGLATALAGKIVVSMANPHHGAREGRWPPGSRLPGPWPRTCRQVVPRRARRRRVPRDPRPPFRQARPADRLRHDRHRRRRGCEATSDASRSTRRGSKAGRRWRALEYPVRRRLRRGAYLDQLPLQGRDGAADHRTARRTLSGGPLGSSLGGRLRLPRHAILEDRRAAPASARRGRPRARCSRSAREPDSTSPTTGRRSRVVALEPERGDAPPGVRIARGKLRFRSRSSPGDGERLARSRTRSFDTVVFTLVLCTIPHPERALAEAKRVLRPAARSASTSTSLDRRTRVARQDRIDSALARVQPRLSPEPGHARDDQSRGASNFKETRAVRSQRSARYLQGPHPRNGARGLGLRRGARPRRPSRGGAGRRSASAGRSRPVSERRRVDRLDRAVGPLERSLPRAGCGGGGREPASKAFVARPTMRSIRPPPGALPVASSSAFAYEAVSAGNAPHASANHARCGTVRRTIRGCTRRR